MKKKWLSLDVLTIFLLLKHTLTNTFLKTDSIPVAVMFKCSSTLFPHKFWATTYSSLFRSKLKTALFWTWFILHRVIASKWKNDIESNSNSNLKFHSKYVMTKSRWNTWKWKIFYRKRDCTLSYDYRCSIPLIPHIRYEICGWEYNQ